jgi:hypothetical protein
VGSRRKYGQRLVAGGNHVKPYATLRRTEIRGVKKIESACVADFFEPTLD